MAPSPSSSARAAASCSGRGAKRGVVGIGAMANQLGRAQVGRNSVKSAMVVGVVAGDQRSGPREQLVEKDIPAGLALLEQREALSRLLDEPAPDLSFPFRDVDGQDLLAVVREPSLLQLRQR